MKSIVILMLIALSWCAFTACETDDIGTAADNIYVQKAFELGVKLGTYKAVQQNPEYIDLANAIANYLEHAETSADLLAVIKTDLVPQYVEDVEARILADELIDTFAELFRTQVAQVDRWSQLPILAQAIRQGVTYAQLNPEE